MSTINLYDIVKPSGPDAIACSMDKIRKDPRGTFTCLSDYKAASSSFHEATRKKSTDHNVTCTTTRNGKEARELILCLHSCSNDDSETSN